MMDIGEFARLGGVSTRMLRHYDRIGLLKPARTDPRAGRRSYDVAQLPVLHRLIALKGLGFSLDEVGVLLGEGVGTAELRGMLRLRQAELERRVRQDRHALARVTARLRLIEEETRMSAQVETKHVDALTIAALSTIAPSGSADLESLFAQVIERMEAVGADRTTPVARLLPGDGSSVEVTAGYVAPDDSVPGLETHRLPATKVASTIHQGPMGDLPAAYAILRDWAESNGHDNLLDSPCWRYHFLEAGGDDETHWIVELQLEL